MDRDTVWLSQAQMGELFDTTPENVLMHLKNIFKDEELAEEATAKEFLVVRDEGQRKVRRRIKHYNLDAILSVGYRVSSKRATQFRQWATRTLKDHLVQGYTLHQQRLAERGIDFEQALSLLSRTLTHQQLVNAEGAAVLAVIADYARSWSLLQQYDEQSLTHPTAAQTGMRALVLDDVLAAIEQLKTELIAKGEATALFGQLRGAGLASSIATIEQGFGDELFYPNVASRAAHLLYFVIKNHPLADGNKRCGSFLFLWYLRLNQHLLGKPVEQLINDHTLVALALLSTSQNLIFAAWCPAKLLIYLVVRCAGVRFFGVLRSPLLVAESLPEQKDLMVRLVEQFVMLKTDCTITGTRPNIMFP